MKQAFPSLPIETKEILRKKGFVPYGQKPLENWQNPYSHSCKKNFKN